MQLATRAIKEAHPELIVITDLCLCEYTSHGHCGVIRSDGSVDNDPYVQNGLVTAWRIEPWNVVVGALAS